MDMIPTQAYAGPAPGLVLALMALGYTPEMIAKAQAISGTPIGYLPSGRPVYAMAGGDLTADQQGLDRKLDELLGEMRKANAVLESEQRDPQDGGRKAAAIDAQKAIAALATTADDSKDAASSKGQLQSQREQLLEQRIAAMESAMAQHGPSKARLVAAGGGARPATRMKGGAYVKAHPVMDATWTEYQAGEFLSAVMDVKNLGDGIDIDVLQRGKAKLQELGLAYLGLPELSRAGYHVVDGEGKATLGATGATGGYVLPNNLVDTVVKPATQRAVYQTLIRVINGVAVRGVDQPYRTGKPARMVFQNWGATKENVDEAYGSYSAVLGTIARIMDIGKQYARFSAGAAEQDVMDELTRAAILGENYYILAGAGTGDVGTGDPTTGVYTALAGSFFVTAHSAVGTTLAGSAATGLAAAFGALASRSREAEAVVLDATTFWTMLAQGTDTAGFWVDPANGPTGFSKTASGGISFWGVPVYYDANLNDNTGTTKRAIAGEWSAIKMYRGMEFRIDSSDVAGDRWDKNLIGFRAEEEIGLNARTAVTVGAMQLVTGLIP